MTYSFRPCHGPGVDSAPSENEYHEHSWSKGGRWVRLTTLPPSCAACHEIWEPKPPGTLWATPGLLQDSFTSTCTVWTVLMTDDALSVQITNSPLTVSHFNYRVPCLTNIRIDLITTEQQKRRYFTELALDSIIVC